LLLKTFKLADLFTDCIGEFITKEEGGGGGGRRLNKPTY